MDAIAAIKGSMEIGEMVGLAYLNDLTDADLMHRPHPECHHINWQIGHLICSENQMVNSIAPDIMPALPEGFAEKYSKDAAASNDVSDFASKDELVSTYQEQRAGAIKALEACSEQDLDAPTGISYAPTKGSMFIMLGSHWLMHCGQWVIVRRETEKPIAI